MTNIPKDVRPFDLQLAIASHPLVTRDGRNAKFIAHIDNVIEAHKVIVQIGDEVYRYPSDGNNTSKLDRWDLFLAPLAVVDNKPVFFGDILVNGSVEFSVTLTNLHPFSTYKWPSKISVIETRMIFDDYLQAIDSLGARGGLTISENQLKAVANKAIERTIMDGDVMPTSLFVKLAGIAYNERINSGNKSFTQIVEDVLKDYLETLK